MILLHADYIANRIHENNYNEIMYSFALLTKTRIETNFLISEVALWLGQSKINEDVGLPLVEFKYLVFIRMPGESYRRRFRSCVVVLVLHISSAN